MGRNDPFPTQSRPMVVWTGLDWEETQAIELCDLGRTLSSLGLSFLIPVSTEVIPQL